MPELAEIKQAITRMSTPDRAELAAFLLSSLEEASYWVEDAKALRRLDELEFGQVSGLNLHAQSHRHDLR
ncbi:MAG: hypothetical protein DVB25_05470 [Verrucomicrobia bacterium]|nr:MAG: hypothetical protein DVB25_05470 [Verrucomicrobiota bacterium]